MHEIVTIVINYVINHQNALLELVGGATGLSAGAQYVLHKINKRWTVSKGFAFTLVQALTLLASLTAYAQFDANFAVVYPWLATVVAVVHRTLVSPVYTKKVLPFLEYEANQEAAPAPAAINQSPIVPVTQTVEAPVGFVS